MALPPSSLGPHSEIPPLSPPSWHFPLFSGPSFWNPSPPSSFMALPPLPWVLLLALTPLPSLGHPPGTSSLPWVLILALPLLPLVLLLVLSLLPWVLLLVLPLFPGSSSWHFPSSLGPPPYHPFFRPSILPHFPFCFSSSHPFPSFFLHSSFRPSPSCLFPPLPYLPSPSPTLLFPPLLPALFPLLSPFLPALLPLPSLPGASS